MHSVCAACVCRSVSRACVRSVLGGQGVTDLSRLGGEPLMCTVLRHRHPARTRADRTQLTRPELTCDGGRRTVGSQVATYTYSQGASQRPRELTLKQHSAFALRHHVLGPSVSRRPPRCFGRCDRLRQRAPTCTAARPRRRGPMRPWLITRCGGCGSVVRSDGAFTHVRTGRKPLHRRCEAHRRLGPCDRPVLALPVSAAHCRGLSACHTVLS